MMELKPAVKTNPRGQLWWGLFFGFIFGFLLHKGGATKYDTIVNQLLLKDFTVLKIMMSAVVVGMPGIFLMRKLGWVTFSPKPGSLGKNILGGLIFGLGFALLGYCPGTIVGAIGGGSLDALISGLLGILLGSALFAAVYPRLNRGILQKGDFGAKTLPELFHLPVWLVILLMETAILSLFFFLEINGL
ncbi:MAG: YeeE/YedE family protein [Anaerolineales bacterium]|nr:YeeE/YedE family protein [Anaerolineales bacterium]